MNCVAAMSNMPTEAMALDQRQPGWRGLLQDLRVLKRGLTVVSKATPRTTALYVVIVVVLSLAPVLQVWLMKLLIDHLSLRAPDGEMVTVLIGLYVLTLLVMAGLQPFQQSLAAWLEDRAVAEVDFRLMEAGVRLTDLVKVESASFQDTLQLTQEAAYHPPRLFAFLQQGVGTALTLIGLFFSLIQLHPLLPLVLLAVTVPHLLAERRLNQQKYETLAEQARAAREMEYCATVTTDPTAAKEVRVFNLGGFFLERFRTRRDAALRQVTHIRYATLQKSAWFGALHAIALAGGFSYVAMRASAGGLTLGDIALYLNVVIQAQSRVAILASWYGFLYESLLHLRGLFAFLDRAKPTITLPDGTGLRAPAQLSQGIEFRQVSFRYPDGNQNVLRNLTMRLPPGKVTALVGANGAGKSTLVKLLTRMYDPTSGQILLDNLPLHAYDLSSLRQRIAVVYQDFARFALTLRESIAVGDLGIDPRDEQVERAARWAGADSIAAKLPDGYETHLTRQFEGGVDLSGGEWQKVALARAFVRDAAFVILDEPTAALDAEAEERLFGHFRELVRGKTALIISHRFSSVRMADYIVVLEDGAITEAGTHDDLVARQGRYAELFEMQAGRYREPGLSST